nr:UvrD-helicase domain-containing protein [Lachnospiraceae bacterium]
DRLVGHGSESIWVATFHSTCVRILRRHIDLMGYDTNFTIYDTDDSKSVMKQVLKRLEIDTKQYPERGFLNRISSCKNELMTAGDVKDDAADYGEEQLAKVYGEYQKELAKNNALDFDDLLMKTVELFRAFPEVLENYQNRFLYIMVDEYQDTNTAQFEFIRLLAAKNRNICVVGDDDQSIYKFRGANIRNILDFEKVYPDAKVVKLEQNYRSTQTILDAANAVIANNPYRKSKSLWTDRGDGDKIRFIYTDTAYEEGENIVDSICRNVRAGKCSFGDNAILYRTNAQSRILEEKCIMAGAPYSIVGGVNFYSRKEIKDVLAYLKTIDNARDDLAVRRIINVPRRGIGATTIGKLADFAEKNDLSFFSACVKAEEILGRSKAADKIAEFVNLIAVFRSKLEFISLEQLVNDILDRTDYENMLVESDPEDATERMENIGEFVNKVISFEETHEDATLSQFLEEVALVSDIDEVDATADRIMLMTLHSAKGLEFPNVYLSGMEDGLFPGYMSICADDPGEMEEERRLCYVGITRAMNTLTISAARSRMIRGETQYNAVSRFVKEIPEELILGGPSGSRKSDDTYPKDRSFGGRRGDDTYSKERPAAAPASASDRVRPVAKPRTVVKPFIARATAFTDLKKGSDMMAMAEPDYGAGDRVSHMKFGQGTVMSVEKGARDYEVTVEFDDAGVKKMLAGFAKLKRI